MNLLHTASIQGDVRITAIKAMRLDDGFCLVRVDTDAGVSGYGECGSIDGALEIENGRMKISATPGLGVDLDEDYLQSHRYAGEPYWA